MWHDCNTSNTIATRVRKEQHGCDTSATRVLHQRHECDTNEILILITTRVKTYFHIPIFSMWQVKDYKERNNFILSTTFGTALSNATMRLKSAPQKLNFVMVKAKTKSYTLDCSCKFPCTFPIVTHSKAASFSIKFILCENTNILFSSNYWKLDKMNARFWKNIFNKGKVRLSSFQNFAYFSNYLHLKSFGWKRDCLISSKLETPRLSPRPF